MSKLADTIMTRVMRLGKMTWDFYDEDKSELDVVNSLQTEVYGILEILNNVKTGE